MVQLIDPAEEYKGNYSKENADDIINVIEGMLGMVFIACVSVTTENRKGSLLLFFSWSAAEIHRRHHL